MRSLTMMMAMVWILAVNGSGMTYMKQPEYSAGTGTNSAYIAVDFDYGTAFVFEYKWDGAGGVMWDAITAVDAAGALNVTATNWGLETPNYFIDDVSYPGVVKHPYDSSLWPYWNIFTSQDSEAWVSPAIEGVSQITVQNNGWYSLLWTYSKYNGSDYIPVRQPGSMPIPEPATLILLAFGVGLLTRKKV